MKYRLLFVLSSVVLIAVMPQHALAADLVVSITDVEVADASIMIEVVDEAGFDSDDGEPTAVAEISADNGTWTVTIPALLPGDYGIMAFQDVNGNGELDFGLRGPKEPFGVSGNPRIGMFSPPSWEKIKVAVGDDSTAVTIRLKN